MTLPNTDIYEEFTVLAGQTSFTLGSNVGYIPQDVDESLKVFIREDARTIVPTSIDITTNQINIPNHAFSVSLQVKVVFTTDNIAPSPLSSGSEYFAQYVDKDNITLSLTSGGAAIDLTSQGVGNHTITTLDPNGIELALNTDFTITKVNQLPTQINFPTRQGVVGQKLFVVRQSSVSQDDVDYTYTTSWKPVEYETHVDKIYAILQEQGNKLSRAMLTRIGDTSSSNLVFPVPQDYSAIGWYSLGSGNFAFRNYDLSIYATQAQLSALEALVGDTVDIRGKVSLPNPFADKTIVPLFNSQSCPGTQINVVTDSFNIVNHGFVTDDPVLYTTTGDEPSPLVNNTVYYVLRVDDDNFQLQAVQSSGIAITITDQGITTTDTHTFAKQDTVIFTSTAHALIADEKVTYKATTAATGLTVETSYYVIVVDANTISLAATAGGAAINVTSVGSNDQVVRSFNTTGTYSTGISIDSAVATSVSIEFEGYRKIDAASERYMGTLKYLYDGLEWQRASEKFDVVEGTPTILFEHSSGSVLNINVKALGLSGVTYDGTSFLKFIGHQLKV